MAPVPKDFKSPPLVIDLPSLPKGAKPENVEVDMTENPKTKTTTITISTCEEAEKKEYKFLLSQLPSSTPLQFRLDKDIVAQGTAKAITDAHKADIKSEVEKYLTQALRTPNHKTLDDHVGQKIVEAAAEKKGMIEGIRQLQKKILDKNKEEPPTVQAPQLPFSVKTTPYRS